jgi:hypothetical protein
LVGIEYANGGRIALLETYLPGGEDIKKTCSTKDRGG